MLVATREFRRPLSALRAAMRHWSAVALLCSVSHAVAPTTVPAQDVPPPDRLPPRGQVDPETVPRPVTRVQRATGAIAIDAVLDEPSWYAAEVITGFVQSKPNTGFPASERTVVRMTFDEENLFVSAVLYERDPCDITLHSLRRDFPPGDGDVLGIALDTYLDRRNAFIFGVNAGGAFIDLQTFDNGRDINIPWDGIVERAARVHDQGWTVEMAIPFSTLRFDPEREEQTWGVNFLRRIRRRGEDSLWAPLDGRFDVNRMAEAGTLLGLSGLTGGLSLQVKPFVLAERIAGDASRNGTSNDADAGIDVKYGVSRYLALDLSYRTDFSQVEVDEEQVNLTRFSLFFPEKRDFFLENAGLFDFGDAPERGYRLGAGLEDFQLFHSRRIGLHEGRPVPVLGGGRLTGQVGEWGVGLLNMQTRSTSSLDPENFTALRLRRTVLGNLQLGGILLNRAVTGGAAADQYNRSFGVDLHARLWGGLIVQSYLAGTRDGDGNGRASRASVAWRDRFLNTSVMYREIGDSFRPEMGYIRRRAIRHSHATIGVHHRRLESLWNELNPFLEVHYITNLESVLETRTGTAGFVTNFREGSRLTLQYNDRFERLLRSFRVLGGHAIATGAYRFREGSVDFQSSAGRVLSGSVGFSGGGYFNGTRRSVRLAAQWKPNYHVTFDTTVQNNRLDLGNGPFSAEVYSGRVEYAYSTTLFGSGFVQYNGVTEELITNLRLNYIHAPLSDFFLVYTERRDTGSGTVLDRRFAAKLTTLWSF